MSDVSVALLPTKIKRIKNDLKPKVTCCAQASVHCSHLPDWQYLHQKVSPLISLRSHQRNCILFAELMSKLA
jgi:hypothetical protein